MKMNMKSTQQPISFKIISYAVVGTVGMLSSENSWSMGKSPSSTPKPVPSTPSYTVPNPKRPVIVRNFANVSVFESPNQVTTSIADSQAILNTIMVNALNSNSEFYSVTDTSGLEGCGTHLELWPAVLDFQLNSTQINVTFGYNQGGSIVVNPALPQATGTDTLSIGSITLSFQIAECPNSGSGSCSVLYTAQADKSVLGNNFTFSVDYTVLGGSGDIISKTNLESKIEQIAAAGVSQLAANPELPTLPWNATVRIVNPDGSFYFDQGTNQNLKPTDYFVVYAQTDAVSVCEVIEPVGCATAVASGMGGPSTQAMIFQTLGGGTQKVQPGDQVLVGSASLCF